MELNKAQRLINKIQAFLDNGNAHELSRLEKDLIKSYVQQLYEAVTSEESTSIEEPVKVQLPVKEPEIFKQKEYKAEPQPTIVPEYKKTGEPVEEERPQPVFQSYNPPVEKPEPVKETPREIEKAFEAKHTEIESKTTEPKVHSIPIVEQVKETLHIHKSHHSTSDPQDALNKLFDQQKSDDSSIRFGHVPIASIESAMGLNERIFTLNELFGGDKVLFDAWCTRLNNLNSFAEAKQVLMSGPARDFKWGDPERIKMAEQFIRIVSRRYPKSPTS